MIRGQVSFGYDGGCLKKKKKDVSAVKHLSIKMDNISQKKKIYGLLKIDTSKIKDFNIKSH